jgi:hypothetical protein
MKVNQTLKLLATVTLLAAALPAHAEEWRGRNPGDRGAAPQRAAVTPAPAPTPAFTQRGLRRAEPPVAASQGRPAFAPGSVGPVVHTRAALPEHRPVYRDYRPAFVPPVIVQRPVVVTRPVYVPAPVYYPEPAPVYYPPSTPAYYPSAANAPAYYPEPVAYPEPAPVYQPEPAPVYYPERDARPNVPGAVGGAVIGGVIGNAVGHGDARGITTAIGALIGGLIGSGL